VSVAVRATQVLAVTTEGEALRLIDAEAGVSSASRLGRAFTGAVAVALDGLAGAKTSDRALDVENASNSRIMPSAD